MIKDMRAILTLNLNLFLTLFLIDLLFEWIEIPAYKFNRGYVATSAGFIVNTLIAAILNPVEASLINASVAIIPKLTKAFFGERSPFSRYVFNFAQIGLSSYLTSFLFHSLENENYLLNIFVILLCGLVFFILNNFFMIIAIYILSGTDVQELISKVISGPVLGSALLIPVIAVIYILYVYMGFIAIPVSLAVVFSIQVGNFYRYKYYEAKLEHLKLLVKSLEEKDEYTRGHSERVAELAKKIAKRLKLSPRLVDRIYNAALLHDVGKIGIPDHILKKPSSLSKEEISIVKTHPEKGEEILKEVDIFRNRESRWVRHHHERWDGKGYPDGLKGEEIPLPSRIIAVADVYEALRSNRPYRKALSHDEAKRILMNEMKGTVLDPRLVDILLEIVEEEMRPEEVRV